MPILPEAKLNRIRAKVNTTLPETCQLSRVVKTPDGRGGVTTTWTTLPTIIPCRLIAMSYDQERIYADAIQNRLGFKVILPFGTDIKDTDKILVNGMSLDIVDIITNQSWQIFIEAIASYRR